VFKPGDKVEFYSEGRWKPGVVAEMLRAFSHFAADRLAAASKIFVRIHVGNGVHVIRKVSKCRKAA
jgi:hypothetical protein